MRATPRCSGAGLESLLEVLEGQLPGQLLSWAGENEAYVGQLTRDQAKVARILREQRQLKVIGSAGTGKTWLALEHARLLAAGRASGSPWSASPAAWPGSCSG